MARALNQQLSYKTRFSSTFAIKTSPLVRSYVLKKPQGPSYAPQPISVVEVTRLQGHNLKLEPMISPKISLSLSATRKGIAGRPHLVNVMRTFKSLYMNHAKSLVFSPRQHF